MTFFEFKVKKWSKIPDARCHCCVQAKSWFSDDEGVLKRRCLVHLTLARHETYTQQQHNIQQHHHLGHPMDKCVNKLAKLLVSHLWLCSTYMLYLNMYAYNYLQSHRYLKILYQWLCCLFTVQCRQLNEPIQESCRIIYGHSIYDFFHTFIIIDVSRFNLKIGIYVGKESFFFFHIDAFLPTNPTYLHIYVRIYQSKKLQYFHILDVCCSIHETTYLESD